MRRTSGRFAAAAGCIALLGCTNSTTIPPTELPRLSEAESDDWGQRGPERHVHNTSGDPVLVHVDRVEVVPYGAYVLMVPPTDQRNPHLEAAYPVAEAYVPDAKEQGWRTQTEFSPPIYAEVQGRALAVRGKGSHGTVFSLDHVSAVRVKEFSAAKTTLLVIGCLAGAAAIGFAAAGVVSYVNHLSWGPT